MAQHGHVPNLDKGVNPTETRVIPDASLSEDVFQSPTRRTRSDPDFQKPNDQKFTSKEDGDHRRPTNSSGDRINSGDPQKRANRIGGGYDRSNEHSPLHQAKSASKTGGSSPSSEKRVSSPSSEKRFSSEGNHGHAPNTPGRSRLRTVGRGDETPERSSEVPRFGEWNENNPSSADGYTQLFNKVREEKQSGAAKVPNITDDSKYLNDYTQDNSFSSSVCCCFSRGKK